MSSVKEYNITSPAGTVDVCAKFDIDANEPAFTLGSLALIKGEEYVISFWVKSDAEGKVSVHGTEQITGAEWGKFVSVFMAESDSMQLSFDVPGTYYLYHTMLEQGNTPSDWYPAPEDVARAEINALTTFMNSAVNGTTTVIDGGAIRTNTIKADKLDVKSLEAICAKIGGFDISENAIYNGASEIAGADESVYLGTDGISCGTNFVATKEGFLAANGAAFQAIALYDSIAFRTGRDNIIKDISGVQSDTTIGTIWVEKTDRFEWASAPTLARGLVCSAAFRFQDQVSVGGSLYVEEGIEVGGTEVSLKGHEHSWTKVTPAAGSGVTVNSAYCAYNTALNLGIIRLSVDITPTSDIESGDIVTLATLSGDIIPAHLSALSTYTGSSNARRWNAAIGSEGKINVKANTALEKGTTYRLYICGTYPVTV